MNAPKTKDTHLPPKQLKILQLLSEGYKGLQIIGLLKMNAPAYHCHCYQIRKKTGIENHNNREACLAYLATYKPWALQSTERQTQVLKLLYEEKRTYSEIQEIMGISYGTAMNHASQGKKRLGIKAYEDFKHPLDAYADDPMNDPVFN